MTFRLVALISVVLLLSLAAFGLIMAVYQDQVMQEVARTASEVGRATLRTLEEPEGAPVPVGLQWQADENVEVREAVLPRGEHMVVIRGFSNSPGGIAVVQEGAGIIRLPDGECIEKLSTGGDGELTSVVTCETLNGESGPAGKRVERLLDERRMFINLEEVRAEPGEGDDSLVLTIPRMVHRVKEGAEEGNEFVIEAEMKDPVIEEILLAKHDELKLPIAVGDYKALFDSLRDRSLFLFLGVFLVGMVLSTGLAARFTRPIRKLDAGIRRITEGDLDVEVEVQGKNEIARLGHAFNGMTRMLRESRERSREIVRREKLSALGGLAAGVAHDVRNPLHSIGLTLEHLKETCRPEAEPRATEFDTAVGMIREEIKRLDQLVGNFLRFARTDRRERHPVDLEDLLLETARLIKKEAEWRKIEVELDITAAVPSISADGEAVRSSILNLVLNSFDAMPDGGKLSLALRVEGESVVVEVADTGQGIPAEDQDRVFEFAYTTRKSGSGLGLAMVHQCIVEEHGGRVSLDSRSDEGTRVRLALPLRPPQREEEA